MKGKQWFNVTDCCHVESSLLTLETTLNNKLGKWPEIIEAASLVEAMESGGSSINWSF